MLALLFQPDVLDLVIVISIAVFSVAYFSGWCLGMSREERAWSEAREATDDV